ncbi:flagellar basal body M-ring protein FliF [Buchnera aphidicola (Hyadaphis tataricae)]|uniref:Flagellar M-ring protein n=1 Tax=Buchnera aphidicola (Hyadaphis tataricae) TaxID=1241859 RepID=A0A4D6YAL4_9GAMM|nr:flagellar basal-body MS-ring/collar protein FliF [Buchnera aphidicola]QCI21395.1 flagellar basal body M-ring protein FliF [Buchnera aphidicola (Hyadaphis tataricae)]
MNFSTIEDSVLEEKKKFKQFLSRIIKNSRILVILLAAAVITAVSVSIWIKSPEYQTLYDNLSNEDSNAIVNQLNHMKIPYKLSDISGKISIPKNDIDTTRLRLSEKNLPRIGSVGFELLDQARFGMSQFNEQINYQRALEGELSRTIQRIDAIKNARIHLAIPKSSLFLEDKKKPSASVVIELNTGKRLDMEQTNAILHLISSSVSNLSVDDISIVDQSGKLLNDTSSFGNNHELNNLQFKYSEEIESRYKNRIKNILEPLLGFGNVYAQVTAQIDFNAKEQTKEKYSPNTNSDNQSIRSTQISIHDKTEQDNTAMHNFLSNKKLNNADLLKKNKNLNLYHQSPVNANIGHEKVTNYELNHSVSHTKMNVGEIKRLSAAVVINFTKDQNGKLIPLTSEKIKNVKNLIREAIGYSKSRGDSIHLVNAPFAKYNSQLPINVFIPQSFKISDFLFSLAPWCLSTLLLLFFLKKYFCSNSRNKRLRENIIENDTNSIETNNNFDENIIENKINNNDSNQVVDHISNISNQNPRTIALIIRQWMSDKK